MPQGKAFEVTEELANQLWLEYRGGTPTTVLAKKYKLSKATVSRNIRRVGGTIRARTVAPQRGLLAWLND